MKLLQDMFAQSLLEDAKAIEAKMNQAKSIIQRYATDKVPFEDFLQRVAGFTNGMSKPNPNVSGEIDIIPVLDELAKAGLVNKRPNGTYKRTDPVGRLISAYVNKKTDAALAGDLSKEGQLRLSQTNQMGHMAGDGDAGTKISNAPLNYKKGGRYSGETKELVLKTIKEKDPAWQGLPDASKDMLTKLASLPAPMQSFMVLKTLIKLKAKKKGYLPFVQYVKDMFKEQSYVDALMDLESIGVLDSKTGMISSDAVRNIRNVMDFLKEEPIEGIEMMDKVAAFLPKFVERAVATSGTAFRTVNNILSSKQFAPILDVIDRKLTDDVLADILATDISELKSSKVKLTIKFLADKLNATTVSELKAAIQEKRDNRMNYASSANKEAKSIGRFDQFLKLFDI